MVKVSELLDMPSFAGTTVVAGNTGLDAAIEDISVMEVPDIEDYVGEGDFLLTTLYPIAAHPEQISDFLARLKKAGLSGIGIKLNRYVPDLPQSCLATADEVGFPLLILPNDGNFSLMINDFLKASIQLKNSELEHRNDIHEVLMRTLLQGDDPQSFAKSLATNLGRDIVLFDAQGEMLAIHQVSDGWRFEMSEVESLVDESAGSGMGKRELSNGFAESYPVLFGFEKIGTVVVCWPDAFETSGMELITLQQFAIVFRIMVQHQMMMEDAAYGKYEAFANDLIYGTVESEEAAEGIASLLKWEMSYPMTILAFRIPPSKEGKADRRRTLNLLRKNVNIRTSHKEYREREPIFWFENHAMITAILNGGATHEISRIETMIAKTMKSAGVNDYYLAESRRASELADIPKLYQECEYTLDIQLQIGQYGLLRFRDIGIYRIIYGMENKEELKSFCADTIGPIIEHDRTHGTDLLKTLETVIESGGNLKIASKRLYVHYNTVRYRNQLAQNLLGKDFQNPDEYLAVSLALKIYRTVGAF